MRKVPLTLQKIVLSKSIPLSAESDQRLRLWNPQAWMLDNGHTKSLSKEAYKWSNRVGARCADHIRPQMQRRSDTNDRMQALCKGLSETLSFAPLNLPLNPAVSLSSQRYYLSKGGTVSGDSPHYLSKGGIRSSVTLGRLNSGNEFVILSLHRLQNSSCCSGLSRICCFAPHRCVYLFCGRNRVSLSRSVV